VVADKEGGVESVRKGGVALTPDGSRAYVTNASSNTVSVIDISPGANFLTVAAGGSLVSTGTGSLIKFDASTVTIGGAIVKLAGRSTATAAEVADGVTLTLGTDQPLQLKGVLVELASGATVTTQTVLRIDTALLAATAPLLTLTAGSRLTTGSDALALSFRAKVTSLGPLVTLDASTLNVTSGALIRLAGGSFLSVTGDLLQLSNGSTITLKDLSTGFLITAAGGSVLKVTGALVNFTGTGGNSIVVKNNVAPTTTLSVGGASIPLLLTNGATTSQVSISGTPIKNSSLGSLSFPNSGSLIKVDGTTAKVTISGL